jgi:AraC-like DNA-binding protein
MPRRAARPVNVNFPNTFEQANGLMPGNFVIAEEFSRLLREFTATVVPGCAPTAAAKGADYDPLRLQPIGDDAPRIEKLLGIPTEVPIEWRLGEYMAANSTNLLTARALKSANFGEAFDVLHQNQTVLTNARTISHRSSSDGALAAVHHAGNAHDPIPRFLFNAIVASKLSLFLKEYSASDRQHQVDHRTDSFGSLMQRFGRELDFIDIEFHDSEITLAFSRDVLITRLSDCDERLRIALDRELVRKTAEVPVTGGLKDRIKYHIRSNHLSEVSLDEICDTFRVQRRTLARLLRDEGTTFTNILTDLRRERALHLVKHTGVPLKRVASELGFNSDASFNMAFKSWTGTTPMKFRKSAARPPAGHPQPVELALAVEPRRSLRSGLLLSSWSSRASA